MTNFSANARLTNHTGADLVAIPPSWEVVTKQKIAESRRKLSFYLQDNSFITWFFGCKGVTTKMWKENPVFVVACE